MQYALNYSGTRFLTTENQNYSMSWWIPSKSSFSLLRLPKNWSSLAKGERKQTAIGKYLYYFFCTVFSKTNAVYILDKNLSHWQLFGNCYKFYTIQTKSKFTFFDRKLCNCKAKEKRSFHPTTLPSKRKLDLTGFTSYGTHKRH